MSLPSPLRRRLLGGLALLPTLRPPLAWARAEHGGPPLLLAQDAPEAIDPAGYLVSEKYDGVRAVWDGTRLRFRSGLPVAAPRAFTDGLPPQPLDGELWFDRGCFQDVSGAVRRATPDAAEWRRVRYMIFELPGGEGPFAQRAARIAGLVRQSGSPQLVAVDQQPVAGRAALQRRLAEVVQAGGEGLVLHRADAGYLTGRSAVLLKLKPLQDAEALVIRHVGGRGKHAGRLGALGVRTPEGIEFLIGTGFSDAERENPPPLGAVVTYTYRGTTAAGVPRFASFLRRHEG